MAGTFSIEKMKSYVEETEDYVLLFVNLLKIIILNILTRYSQ
jgi:hypothetical protein